jgi:uncharacterized protein DUF3347
MTMKGTIMNISHCHLLGGEKESNMKKTIYVLAVAVFSLTAFNYGNAQSKTTKGHSMDMQKVAVSHNGDDYASAKSTVTTENTEATLAKSGATSEIIDAYLEIKNALVTDDKKGAAAGGKVLLTAFGNFDMTILGASQHKEYMKIVDNAKVHTDKIVKGSIDDQRMHFIHLSSNISDLITLVGTDKTLYEDFCPMANDEKGAIWISEMEDIKNPFFGSKMVTCGKVQKQIN